MPADSLQATLMRYGDALYRVALLREPPAQAQQTLLAVMAAVAPGAGAVDELWAALLRRQLRAWPRRPWLPRTLWWVGGWERALLWLWLHEGVDGPRLVAIAGVSADTLVVRLAAALLRIVPDDRARAEPLYRADFALWLTERLRLPRLGNAAPTEREQAARWEAALHQTVAALDAAVGKTPLPPACGRALAELSYARPVEAPERRSWRMPALLAVALLLGLLITRPSRGQGQPPPPPAISAREVVRRAVDQWLALPTAGVRHRRVVALAAGGAPDAAQLTTDVWDEVGGERHRVEVHSGAELVEWQIGDGRREFRYAAEPRWSSCRWAGSPAALDGRQLLFGADSVQQRAVRERRLRQGAFGQGLVFLERALAAPELVSFGARPAAGSSELTLRFVDTAGLAPRTLLLTLDTHTQALRAVHQIEAVGARRVTSELWRLVVDEQAPGPILQTAPPWPEADRAPRQLWDVGCPALLPERVPSLRIVAGSPRWSWQVWLPRAVPPGVDAGALVSARAQASDAQFASDTEVLLAGGDRLLRVRASPLSPSALPTTSELQGRWRFFEPPDGDTQLRTCLSAPAPDLCAGPLLDITARGWESAALLELVQSLAPLDMALWSRYEPLFVDPRPLAPNVRAALIAAAQAEADTAEGLRYLAVERRVRVDPRRPAWPDPYHLPLELLVPERTTVAQWRRASGGALASVDQLATSAEGDLLAAIRIDHTHTDVYWRTNGTQSISSRVPAMERAPQPLTEQLLGSLFGSAAPLTAALRDDLVILEQRQPGALDPLGTLAPAPVQPWQSDIVADSVVLRVVLNAADYRVRWSERSAMLAAGRPVVLVRSEVLADGGGDPARFVAPQLPTDTLTIREQTGNTAPEVMSTHMELRLPRRALVWPAGSDVVVESDRNSFSQTQTMVGQPIGSSVIMPNLESPIYGFDTTLLKVTRYQLAGLGGTVTIRQGPRDFLAHVLRYQSQSMLDTTHTWIGSRPVALTIGGRATTGWIVQHLFETALVVESDDVLLYITASPEINLDGPLLAKLAELRWVELGE